MGLVQVTDVAEHVQLSTLRPQLLERPDVVVGTPSRILAHLKAGECFTLPAKPVRGSNSSSPRTTLTQIFSARKFGSSSSANPHCGRSRSGVHIRTGQGHGKLAKTSATDISSNCFVSDSD